MTDVSICTPHGGMVAPEYYRRILEMQNQSLQHTFVHMEVDLQIIGKARNILVQETLSRTKCDVLWFIDSDTYIPANAGVLIDQAVEYGIVSGMYFNRHPPYTPQAYKLSSKGDEVGMYEAIMDYPETGIMVVDAVGAGCLAVHRRVFEKLQEGVQARYDEYLELIRYELRNDGKARKAFEWLSEYSATLSPWFEFLENKGEDFYFCERARDAGFPIFVNVDVKCEHLSQVLIGEGHFQYLKQNKLLVRLNRQGQPIDDQGNVIAPEEVAA